MWHLWSTELRLWANKTTAWFTSVMRNIIRYILIIILILIVIYVNFYEKNAIWRLIYYSHQYLIVSVFIYLIWRKLRDNLTRTLLIGLGFYYGFQLIMDVIEIINIDLYILLYKKKTINYVLASGVGLSLFSLILYKKIKNLIKSFKRWRNYLLSNLWVLLLPYVH